MSGKALKETWKCPSCGTANDLNETEFEISEDASMTCPVCNSKYSISAILVEPGTPPEGIEPGEEEFPPDDEVIDDEVVPGEEDAAAGAEDVGQIEPKESVEIRIKKAQQAIADGKGEKEVMATLLTTPMAIHSPKPMKLGEARGKVIDLTPSVSQYRHMLQIVKANSTSRADKAWAKDELERIAGVKQWRTSAEKADEPLPGKRGFQDPDSPIHQPRNERVALKEPKQKMKEASADLRYFQTNSGASFVNDLGYSIYFSFDGYVEISKDGKIVADFYPEDVTLEEAQKINSGLREADDKKKEWEGDFATFNSKLIGCTGDLNIPVEKIEVIIADLQDKDALSLNNDKVTINLDKAKTCLVDFLSGQDAEAEAQAVATDLSAPPPETPDLGSAPADLMAASIESKKVAEGDNEDTIQDQVERVLNKYFA